MALADGLEVAQPPASSDAGFSLAEILLVVALAAVLLGYTVVAYQSTASSIQGDANVRIVEQQLKLARDTAAAQRRSVEVRFVPPNQLLVVRRDLPAGTTQLQSAVLENNTTFFRFPGVPDTPDTFGGAGALNFGGAPVVMFTADGMFVDAAGTPVNGTVYLGQEGKPFTQRALTIFGSTARIRTYRWNGSQWGN